MAHDFSDINLRLCHLCGTCAAVCPAGIIRIEEERIFLTGECTNCGNCYTVCPGLEMDFTQNVNSSEGSKYIGHYQQLYSGFATDSKVRQNGSSGGLVTALASYLIKEKLVDSVVITTGMNGDDSKVVSKPSNLFSEIESAAGSKYLIAPVNKLLKELDSTEARIAVIGLPCHLHGISKIKMVNLKLAEKIKYRIGLFCGFNMSIKATADLLRKLNIRDENIKSLKYRSGDFPSGFQVESKDGIRHQFSKELYNFLNFMYVPYRCLLCPDLTAENSDVSFGDFWTRGREKESLVVVRSGEMTTILEQMSQKNISSLKEIDFGLVYNSHRHLFKYKKHDLQVRLSLFKPVPQFKIKFPRNTIYLKVRGYFFTAIIFLMQTKLFHSIFYLFPIHSVDSIARKIGKIIKRF